jgi:heme o synthase
MAFLSNTRVHTPSVSMLSDFKEITKMRLAISVVFSSVAGYFLGAEVIDFVTVLLLAIGGYLMVGASNAYNQILEKDLDALDGSHHEPPVACRENVC